MGESIVPKSKYSHQAIQDLIGKDVLKSNAERMLASKRESVAALVNGIKEIEDSPYEEVTDQGKTMPKSEFLELVYVKLEKELDGLENLKKRVGELA